MKEFSLTGQIDNRPTIYIEELIQHPELIERLMTERDTKVEEIIGGRISPESRDTLDKLLGMRPQSRHRIF